MEQILLIVAKNPCFIVADKVLCFFFFNWEFCKRLKCFVLKQRFRFCRGFFVMVEEALQSNKMDCRGDGKGRISSLQKSSAVAGDGYQ